MGRARLTNKLRMTPPGLDGNSKRGRRWRDFLEAAIGEYETDYPDKVREIAMLRLGLEDAQTEVFAGDISQSENVVRISNLISRREKELRAKARQRQSERPRLADYRASKARSP